MEYWKHTTCDFCGLCGVPETYYVPATFVDSLWSTGNILPATFVDSLWSTGNILPAIFVDSLLSTGNILPATLLCLSGSGKTIPGDEQFRERTHHAGKAVGRVPGIDQIFIKTQNLNVGVS